MLSIIKNLDIKGIKLENVPKHFALNKPSKCMQATGFLLMTYFEAKSVNT